jgi:DNA mismatch repair ATPase MutS
MEKQNQIKKYKQEIEKLEKEEEFIKSFFLGKVIYIANEKNYSKLEINSLNYNNDKSIYINKIFIPKEKNGILTYLVEVKDSGYFKDDWKCFLTEEEAQEHYAQEKIKVLAQEIEKIAEKIIAIRSYFFKEERKELKEKSKKISNFLTNKKQG